MPQTRHIERHFTGSAVIRDIVIGMSDGLTVPFALAAGLSAIASTAVIVTAGLAEIAAGSISMGLGGYLAAKSDAEHYGTERQREDREIDELPHIEDVETTELLESYGLTPAQSVAVVQSLKTRKNAWIDFMMRFELGLEEPNPKRALTSALTIAGAYAAGGAVPLAPYVFLANTRLALGVSVAVTLLALLVFGYVKARFTGVLALRSALQTLLVGGLAAGVAFAVARAIS